MGKEKVLPREKLAQVLKKLREEGKRIVFTNGCFDILHPGHLKTLREAKKRGDVLVVAINSDDSVRRIKGEERPFTPEEERAEILASLEMVDFVTIFEEDTPYQIIKELRPDILVKGADWAPDKIIGRDLVESWGGEVVLVPPLPGYSTTQIIKKIRETS